MTRGGVAGHALAALGRPAPAATAVAAVFAALAVRAATARVDDPDVWWIAAAGRDMLAALRVPARNVYSYTDPTHPWIMHELLFGVAYAKGLAVIGPAFFSLLSLVLASAAVAFAATTMLSRARHPASAPLSLLLLLGASRNALFAPRPSHASLILPLAMTALALRPGWSRRRTAAAVLLEVAWTNTHGSFLLGPAILIAAAFDAGPERDERSGRLCSALLALLATAINPYGLRLHGLVGLYVFGGDEIARTIHRHVVEFFPLWQGREPFVNPFNVIGLSLVLALAAAALWRRRNLARALFALGLVALAVHQVRHVTLAVVLGTVWMQAEIDDELGGTDAAPALDPRPYLVACMVLPGLALGVLLWWRCQAMRPGNDWIAAGVGGSDFARLARELPAGARVYVPFQSSGLLVWLDAPRAVRVFFDSRNDCYDAEVAKTAFALELDRMSSAEARAALARYETDAAIVPARTRLAAALSASHDWVEWGRQGPWTGYRRRERRPVGSTAPAKDA